ncbi:hypothetical protein AB0I72_23425 [Nocardiopsis sp. NPDC049922]
MEHHQSSGDVVPQLHMGAAGVMWRIIVAMVFGALFLYGLSLWM